MAYIAPTYKIGDVVVAKQTIDAVLSYYMGVIEGATFDGNAWTYQITIGSYGVDGFLDADIQAKLL